MTTTTLRRSHVRRLNIREARALAKRLEGRPIVTDDPDCQSMTETELAGPCTIGRPRRTTDGTMQVTARIDRDLIAWLKAAGQGYQTRLNAILRAAMEAETVGRRRHASPRR